MSSFQHPGLTTRFSFWTCLSIRFAISCSPVLNSEFRSIHLLRLRSTQWILAWAEHRGMDSYSIWSDYDWSNQFVRSECALQKEWIRRVFPRWWMQFFETKFPCYSLFGRLAKWPSTFQIAKSITLQSTIRQLSVFINLWMYFFIFQQ